MGGVAMRSRQKQRVVPGFTLIELLVALSLVGIVLAAAGTMLLQAYANESAYREQNQAQQNARAACDIISDDLRGAAKKAVGVAGALPAVGTTTTFGATAFIFTVFNDSGNETLVSYTRDPTSKNLSRAIGIGSAVVVARNIEQVTVTTGTNTVDMTVVSTVGSSPNPTSSVTVRAKVTLRNYLF